VNGERALERDGILANRNCRTIPLTMTLKPLHDAACFARVRVSTYQSVSRAGRHPMDELRAMLSAEGNLAMDWDFEGEEFDEESKLRAGTCKIVELPERPISATCVRVPVLVSRAEAVWVETRRAAIWRRSPRPPWSRARHSPPGLPCPHDAAGIDDVLVGRIRRDPTVANGLVFFVVAEPSQRRCAERYPDRRTPGGRGGRGRR
jgi:aspartate-semialdehyde dehydrogenase